MTGTAAIQDLLEKTPVHADIRIDTITDDQSFLDLEPVWNEVAEAAGLNHPFLEYAWVRTWWESFGAGSTLHVLVLSSGDRPIAIAPLILTPIRMWGIKVRRLGFFYNAHDAWVRTWWESFGAGSTLQVLVLKAGDRPIAIAPLILTPIRMWGIKISGAIA